MIKLRYISSISRSRGLPLSLDNLLRGSFSRRVSFPGLLRAIPARTLSGSRAAAEQSDPQLHSFRWILRDGKTYTSFYFSICFASGQIIVSSCCCCSSSCCCDDQASIYIFELSVSRSTAFSRPLCAGRLRRLRSSLPCLFGYPSSRWSDPELHLFCWILTKRGDNKKLFLRDSKIL